MPENESQKPPESKPTEGKEQEIKITVDNKQTEILAKQLAEAEASKKATEEKLAKIEADKKAIEEAAKKSAEEAEDLKNKLSIIAEKELEKKRKAVTEKATALLGDPERIKEITDKLSTLEGIKNAEFTINMLEDQIKKGQVQFEQYKADEIKKQEEAVKKAAEEAAAKAAAAKTEEEKKAAEEAAKKAEEEAKKLAAQKSTPSGSAPLNTQQMGGGQAPDLMHMKFDSYAAMVRYLQEVENGPDKELAAQARVALNQLLQKWAALVKQSHDAMTSTPPEQIGEKSPLIKEMALSKRAKEELRRRQQGNQPESVSAT